MDKLLCVVGTTGSGKSALALELARKFRGEILAADSRVVYRGMDIGTAKILGQRIRTGEYADAVVADNVYHWLQDLVEPDEPFTVADWKRAALLVISKIIGRGHLPIMVGGTGLYIKALVDNLEPPAVPPLPELRRSLENRPLTELVAMLFNIDPEAQKTVDLRNPRRVIRAIEVARGIAPKVADRKKSVGPLFDTLQLAIGLPRAELYRRIDERVEEQVAAGLFEEVERLFKKYGPDLPALSAIGYREIVGGWTSAGRSNLLSRAAIIQRIKYDTHAYARRQLTWFRRDKRIRWIKNTEEAEATIEAWLGK